MIINISVLKGDLNGKIVVMRFFFCRVYFDQKWWLFIYLAELNKKGLYSGRTSVVYHILEVTPPPRPENAPWRAKVGVCGMLYCAIISFKA